MDLRLLRREKQMLLSRYEGENWGGQTVAARPLIVTKESPRKAVFYKLNRSGQSSRKMKRLKHRAGVLRGNVFAGSAYGQRVIIKINPVKNKTRGVGAGAGSGGMNLYHHMRYISRSGAGENEEKAVLFDKENEGLDGKEFHGLCKDDRHHFRMIISPENGHEIEDFRGYVRCVMKRVEEDLGTSLDWRGAVHYDTDDIHAHVVIRGKDERGEDLVIGRDYIATGIRARAQEIATELLGERSLEEIQKSMEREVDAMRVTSLDRFIEKQVSEENVIDVRRANNFGKSSHFEGLIKGRLRHLETAGFAVEHPPGVFTLKEDYKDALYAVATRNDVLKRLHGQFAPQELDGMAMYSIKAGEGAMIEGRVAGKGFTDEITDRKYITLHDMAGGLHYVPVGDLGRYDELEEGALIRVRPGDKSTGKADHNIKHIAKENDGIYDREAHMRFIIKEQDYIAAEDRQGYLDAHLKRLDTLEQNGVVEGLGEGRYSVPDDIIVRGEEITKQINEREKKRFYPRIDVLSAQPLEQLTASEKKTWLDKELYKQSINKPGLASYDDGVRSALQRRREWLVQKDLATIQSNGEFALRKSALNTLNKMEVERAGKIMAEKFEVELNRAKVREEESYRYVGFVKLETGPWALVSKEGADLQMAQLTELPEGLKRGDPVGFKSVEGAQFEMQALEQQKQQEQQRQQQVQERDVDMEF